nr:uncharacterized protein LOC120968676 [Aegilops tauschii subsp. strangulata]
MRQWGCHPIILVSAPTTAFLVTTTQMDRRWIHGTLFSREYIEGVKEFMNFIQEKFSEDDKIFCPCRKCLNHHYQHQTVANTHILTYGMESTYTRWIYHGEDFDVDVIEHRVDVHDTEDGDNGADRFEEMFEDLRTAVEQAQSETENQDANNGGNPYENESFLKNVMKEAKRQLYHGCTKFSRFSFVVKLLHLKSYHRIPNSAFTEILKLLAQAFPKPNTLPKSYKEAKNLLKELGLGYESIHVCFNNCILFRKQYANHDNCPVCGLSRWKDPARKKIPQKVLRHFPLLPRLKRMFLSKKGAEEAQWHELKRQPNEKQLSHPKDGDAWKDFDEKFPEFAKDARNFRLGIATDGFNPFGNFNTTYSPKSSGKHFDVFLQPLVEELLVLWEGVRTYDALRGKMFDLHAEVLCLRSKIGYIGHYRFLPRGHRLRRNNEFVGLHESNDEPGKFSEKELQAELEKVRPGIQQESRKRKCSDLGSKKDHVPIWGRRVCLWDLKYWAKLKLRHNLDVMHIEKNICENLIGTILNLEGKTKDTLNARIDLKDLNIKEELQLRKEGDSYVMPRARYTLSKEQVVAFCQFLRELKFPDGFASNISRCTSADGTKVQGLKTHDCHILLQRILPAGMRGLLDSDIYQAIAELGNFFRELCSKTLNRDVLAEMKKEIPVILCKLEKIFPPAFFDVMVHLAVHYLKRHCFEVPATS